MANNRHIIIAVLAMSCGLLGSPQVAADTLTVCNNGCDFTSINAAIAAASNGDVVQLSGQTYFEGAPIDTLGKQIRIRGARGTDGVPLSVLDGASSHTILRCERGESSATVLEDLVMQNGAGDDIFSAGGVVIYQSSPVFIRCWIRGNEGYFAGGVSVDPGSPVFIDCHVVGNSGSGVFVQGSSPIFTNCRIQGNSAYEGGGLNVSYGTATLIGCQFMANTAIESGGGVNCRGDISLRDCTFIDNAVTSSELPELVFNGGGGLAVTEGSATITDCVFAGNSAVYGGGLNLIDGTAVISNTNFDENYADIGAGVMIFHRSFLPPVASITGCTFSNNYADLYGAGLGFRDYLGSSSKEISLANCRFEGGLATRGAAAYLDNVTGIAFSQCTFVNGTGNLVYNRSSSPEFSSCVFTNNPGSSAIWNYLSSNPTIDSCTFQYNYVEPDFPFTYNVLYSLANSRPKVFNTIMCSNGNGINQVIGPFDDLGGNCIQQSCDGCLPLTPPCPADFNADQTINGADLALLLGSWATAAGDLNADGTTDGADLALVLGAWGPCPQ